MKVRFLVEAGNLGVNGTKVDLSKVEIPKKVKIGVNFNPGTELGEADLELVDGKLYGTAEIPDRLMRSYPAIRVSSVKTEVMDEGGLLIVSGNIDAVSLSSLPNSDDSIPMIFDNQK